MRVLLTGAAGFIGSQVARELVARGHSVVALDALTYAGNLENLKDVKCEWLFHDFTQPLPDIKVDAVIHNGANSHVDRSLTNPGGFVAANLLGTLNLLEFARKNLANKFIYVSTDEVFGADRGTPHEENDRLGPTNPYAATKAGAEHLVQSYRRSFGVPALITRSCNVFGPRQHREKFVPLVIGRILRREKVEIHTGPGGKVGARRWCDVGTQARALAFLVDNGEAGQTYHVSEGMEKTNLEMATAIAEIMGQPWEYELLPSGRKSYDEAYSLVESKFSTCWKINESFEATLSRAVAWYLDNPRYL